MADDVKQDLEREGDIAADYLEGFLDIADLDGDIEIAVREDRPNVAIVVDGDPSAALKRLIGKDGITLNSLQDLTRLAVQQETGERSRVMVDIAGYREERRAAVQELAERAIAEVNETGDEIELDPMNPFERKVVHDAAAAAGLDSDSEGYGRNRHVVIRPAGGFEEDEDADFDDEYEDGDDYEDDANSDDER